MREFYECYFSYSRLIAGILRVTSIVLDTEPAIVLSVVS